MHGAGYRYVTAGGWTAVALPYRGGRLTMTALLPPAGRAALRCQVPPAAALRIMDTALARTGPTVAIALPKVSLVTHQDMKGLLTLLGMGIAFDRPYLMLVTDAETGEPLFLARVANPGR